MTPGSGSLGPQSMLQPLLPSRQRSTWAWPVESHQALSPVESRYRWVDRSTRYLRKSVDPKSHKGGAGRPKRAAICIPAASEMHRQRLGAAREATARQSNTTCWHGMRPTRSTRCRDSSQDLLARARARARRPARISNRPRTWTRRSATDSSWASSGGIHASRAA